MSEEFPPTQTLTVSFATMLIQRHPGGRFIQAQSETSPNTRGAGKRTEAGILRLLNTDNGELSRYQLGCAL